MNSLLLVCSAVWTVWAGEAKPINLGESYDLHSEVLNEDRTLWVHLPPSYEGSQQRFPVLYLLDGDAHFVHTIGTVEFLARQNQCLEMIVIAITNTDRTRDMTPTRATVDYQGNPTDTMPTSGGADQFLNFMSEELIPHVEATYRTQPYRMFVGHSFGGLLTMYALFSRPDMFNAYVAVSPSVWWQKDFMVDKASQFLKNLPASHKSLFMTIADEDGAMRSNFDTIVDQFEAQSPAKITFGHRVMEDESHGSLVMRSHYQAFRKLFEKLEIPENVRESGLAAVVTHYQNLSEVLGYNQNPPENTVNQLGYYHLGNNHFEKAVALFEYNVKTYPESANVYDSLGEAHEKQSHFSRAAELYEKAYQRALKTDDSNTALFKTNLDRAKRLANASTAGSAPSK